MTKVICIGSQKGGIGKSTLTMLVATYMHAAGNKIFLVDADYPQHSTEKVRTTEVTSIENDPVVKAAFEEKGLAMYELSTSTIPDASGLLPVLKEQGIFDYIFIDLPGTLNVDGIAQLGLSIDYFITPMEMDPISFSSGCETIEFYHSLNPSLPIFMLWNKVVKAENAMLMEGINNYVIQQLPYVKILETVITQTVKIKRARSTVYPTDEILISNLVNELFGENGLIKI